MQTWQLQEAKARFSEVVKKAHDEGPQEVTVRGEPSVVVLAREEYDRLVRPRPSLVAFMQASPMVGVDLNLDRDQSPVRDVSL
ncbi:type II toxin-antitoxin system Phd/YefM family antitoxin [Desulfonatronum parangueonense]